MPNFAECLEKKNSKEFSLPFLGASIFLWLCFLKIFTIMEVQKYLKILILRNQRKLLHLRQWPRHFRNVFPVTFCTPEIHWFRKIFNSLFLKVKIFRNRFLLLNKDLPNVNFSIYNFGVHLQISFSFRYFFRRMF